MASYRIAVDAPADGLMEELVPIATPAPAIDDVALHAYIDRTMTPEARDVVTVLIHTYGVWRARYDELLAERAS